MQDIDLDVLILRAASSMVQRPLSLHGVHYLVCKWLARLLPAGELMPGGRVHERMFALIADGRLERRAGRLVLRDAPEQARCRARTGDEDLAVAGAEVRRRQLLLNEQHRSRCAPGWQYEQVSIDRAAAAELVARPAGAGWEPNDAIGAGGVKRFGTSEVTFWRRPVGSAVEAS